MRRGTIPVEELAGGIHLGHTLESGQSYLWHRRDGRMYEEESPGADVWYETVIDGEYVGVCQRDEQLEWVGSSDAEETLYRVLRLNDDLDGISQSFPTDELLDTAWQRYAGMRLVRDPPFPCLISFICSTQMRVPRIHAMQRRLAHKFGETITVDGTEHHAFPKPEVLAAVSEDELRACKLGYRAPYVKATAARVLDGHDPMSAAELPYSEAREDLTAFPGVGPKVADCVLLFSLGFTEAVPLDTWIKQAIETYYPECDRGSYESTSEAIRERLGGTYAGYAQTYVFHLLRQATDISAPNTTS